MVTSKGGAETNGLIPTFWGKEVYNRKKEMAIGFREACQPTDYLRFAKNNLYSPYLQVVGSQSVGYFFGIKAEFWIWK